VQLPGKPMASPEAVAAEMAKHNVSEFAVLVI